MLELHGISKHFGPVRALAGVDFAVRAGEVHALLGENGAGKSTLMHIAYGLVPADAGEILVHGRPAAIRSPRDARALGLGMVHQHFTSVPALSVRENIALAGGRVGTSGSGVLRRLERDLDPDALVETLSVGLKQRLEIAKALATDARMLLLDEPTAVLAPVEVDELMEIIRAFAGDGGAVVLITHKLREAFAVADRVTVLRQGALTLAAPMAGQTVEGLASAMVGGQGTGEPTHGGEKAPRPEAPVLIRLDAASVPPLEHRGPGLLLASMDVRAGELVGVAAVEGNGQRELMLAVAGVVRPTAGRLEVAQPVAHIPEDRTTEGLIPDLSLTENVALGRGRAARWVRGIRIDWADADRYTAELLPRFDVRAPGPATRAGLLSGGNQQKLVLARALDEHPRVLVAENPTRGLDLSATAAVHARLRGAAEAGVAVLFHSSDLDEVLELADRVVVVVDGRVVHLPAGAGRDAIGAAMLGVHA